MPAALVDTNVLIAASSERDRRHEAGRAIVAGADRGDLPRLYVTNYVVAETLNYVSERAGQSQAVELYDRLDTSAGFEFVRATKGDDHGAMKLFRTEEPLSFVDATLGAYADRAGIEYCYSFDDDLDTLQHVSRLDRPVDPYAPE